MPSLVQSLAAPLLCLLYAHAAFGGELSCQSERRFGREGALQVAVRLQRTGSVITGLAMDSTTVVFTTRTGYPCSAEFDRNTPDLRWETVGDKTTIASSSTDPDEQSVVSIQRTARGYLIDPQGLSRISCGARGQWPQRVLVPLRGTRCVTTY